MTEKGGRPALQANHGREPLVAWVGTTWTGNATYFRSLVQVAAGDPRIQTLALPLPLHREDGLERYRGILPAKARKGMRVFGGTLPLYRRRDVDVVWSQFALPILPWLLTVGALRGIPIAYSTDATAKQLHDFGPLYKYYGGRTRAHFAARNRVERYLLHRMALITPLTEWAARSMREDYGVPAERIRVLPPSIDIDFWRPSRAPVPRGRVPRALFVGEDFKRKGGDFLLDVFRWRFQGRLELDLVTRGDVRDEPGVRVHTGLSLPQLLALYQRADLFVLPTYADCFPGVGMEALACGLPVILGRTGGSAEVFEDGVEGHYVDPGDRQGLAAALEQLVSQSSLRDRMGAAGRALAERRYDRRRNTSRLIDWLLEIAAHTRRPAGAA